MARAHDGSEKTKFKRYNPGRTRGAGKDNTRREAQVSDEQFQTNWDRTFGKKKPQHDPETCEHPRCTLPF